MLTRWEAWKYTVVSLFGAEGELPGRTASPAITCGTLLFYTRTLRGRTDLAGCCKNINAINNHRRKPKSRKRCVMKQSESGAEQESPSRRSSFGGLRKLAIPVASTVGAFRFLGAGLPWLKTIIPHWVIIRGGIVFLWFLLGFFILAVPAAATGIVWSWRALDRARRRRDNVALARTMKWFLLSSSGLMSLIVMEAAVRFMDHQSYRIPDPQVASANAPAPAGDTRLPAQKGSPRDRTARDERDDGDGPETKVPATKPGGKADFRILVIGESSALGEPYEPWLSVGQIVGWKLQSIVPDRTFDLDIRARGGFCLEQALLPLSGLEYKPDAIVLFSGHNEFHARYGWSRNVAYYAGEGPESLLGLQDLMRSVTGTTHVIFKNLDRFYGEAPPLPVSTANSWIIRVSLSESTGICSKSFAADWIHWGHIASGSVHFQSGSCRARTTERTSQRGPCWRQMPRLRRELTLPRNFGLRGRWRRSTKKRRFQSTGG